MEVEAERISKSLEHVFKQLEHWIGSVDSCGPQATKARVDIEPILECTG